MNTKKHLNTTQEKISEEGQRTLTAEQSESLGLQLEVDNPQTGKIKFTTSEKVALKLGPWVIALIALLSGFWLWAQNMHHPSPPLPPTAETQIRQ